MFVVLLEFSNDKDQAERGRLMQAHQAWIARGFDEGAFALVGSLEPRRGGAIVARAGSLAELRARVDDDPFVAEGIVSAEILEITPSRADERLAFLLG